LDDSSSDKTSDLQFFQKGASATPSAMPVNGVDFE
jgi:hypothetical protein